MGGKFVSRVCSYVTILARVPSDTIHRPPCYYDMLIGIHWSFDNPSPPVSLNLYTQNRLCVTCWHRVSKQKPLVSTFVFISGWQMLSVQRVRVHLIRYANKSSYLPSTQMGPSLLVCIIMTSIWVCF